MASHNRLVLKRGIFFWLTISNFLYIIVLLILAGVSISILTGDNGILTKAETSKIKNEQATVKEQVMLAYGEYQIEIQTASSTKLASTTELDSKNIKLADIDSSVPAKTFLQYLERKEYINLISETEGIVNVEKLVGNNMTLGKGTGKSDVYIVILDKENLKYVLNYYDAKEDETFLWSVNINENDIDKLIEVIGRIRNNESRQCSNSNIG